MRYGGRAVVVSELDPVPSGLRIGPCVLVMSRREADAVAKGDRTVQAQLNAAIRRYDLARLRRHLDEVAR